MKRYPTKQYAKALFFSCQDSTSLEKVYRDIQNISALIQSSDELENFLGNPVILSEKRKQILEDIFKEKFDPLTFQFLLLLEKKGRLSLLKAICSHFEELYFAKREIIKATIITREALAASQVAHICEQLKKKLKKTIQPELKIAKDLLGGIKVKVGDIVYDFSLRTQLEQFKRTLIGV